MIHIEFTPEDIDALHHERFHHPHPRAPEKMEAVYLKSQVNKLPEVAGQVGHPRRKPGAQQGDLAYDSEPHRQGLREMGIEPVLPEKGIDDDTGLGATRWPVERTLSWVHQDRRLRIRYERRPDIHQAFLTVAFIKICATALLAGLC
jgi:hypothetical protein